MDFSNYKGKNKTVSSSFDIFPPQKLKLLFMQHAVFLRLSKASEYEVCCLLSI